MSKVSVEAAPEKEVSDREAGVEFTVAVCDGEFTPSYYQRCIYTAAQRVRRFAPFLLEVFYLIVANGSNRAESIGALAASRNLKKESAKWRDENHRGRLLMLFGEW